MKQYNRVCARINLDAIAYNMEQMKNRIGQEGRLIAVIKTDAYGHGNALYLGLRCSMHGRSKNFKSTWNQETNLDSWLCFS